LINRPNPRDRARVKRPEHFGLTGPSVKLDRRVAAVRGDVADIALAGTIFAPHYAAPLTRACTVPSTAVRAAAGEDAEMVSELLEGELFEVLDLSGGWAWGYSAHDHYVGYVREDALGPATGEPRMDTRADPVETARSFLGMRYVLGGRGGVGIDCSGLVQRSLATAGVAVMRDSDQQAETVGTLLPPGTPPQRGDLVFFPGHVGMMIDGERLIHATSHAGSVVIEPLADVSARVLGPAETPMVRRP